MGDERTPSWFWPVFVGGLVLVCVAILASGIAGVGLIASQVQYGSRGGSGSCPSCGPTTPPRVYVPVTTPIAPVAPAAPVAAPIAPVAPPVAPVGGEGSLAVEVVVHDSRGRAAPRAGTECALEIDFADASVGGDAACHGQLRCGGRTLWRAERDDAVACSVDRGGATLRLRDDGSSGRVTRPRLDVDAGPDGATVSVDGRGTHGGYSISARSE